jgi:hypothetical protein
MQFAAVPELMNRRTYSTLIPSIDAPVTTPQTRTSHRRKITSGGELSPLSDETQTLSRELLPLSDETQTLSREL